MSAGSATAGADPTGGPKAGTSGWIVPDAETPGRTEPRSDPVGGDPTGAAPGCGTRTATGSAGRGATEPAVEVDPGPSAWTGASRTSLPARARFAPWTVASVTGSSGDKLGPGALAAVGGGAAGVAAPSVAGADSCADCNICPNAAATSAAVAEGIVGDAIAGAAGIPPWAGALMRAAGNSLCLLPRRWSCRPATQGSGQRKTNAEPPCKAVYPARITGRIVPTGKICPGDPISKPSKYRHFVRGTVHAA